MSLYSQEVKKLFFVLETAAMSQAELNKYCRKHG
jgi:hypothetical protein